MREVGHVEVVIGSRAAAESRQVGDIGVELIGEKLCGRQQIAARETETMHMHHHRTVGRSVPGFAIEDLAAANRRPVLS